MNHATNRSVRQANPAGAAAPRSQSISGGFSLGGQYKDSPALGAGQGLANGQDSASPVSNSERPRLFNFDAQGLRVVGPAEAPWFVAKDVCDALGLPNVSLAISGRADRDESGLDDDEKGIAVVNTLGGPQEMLTVNESGLYALIFRSRKPQARLFRKWVTSEVLPAIRKNGAYSPEYPKQRRLTAPIPNYRMTQLHVRSSAPVEHVIKLCQTALSEKPGNPRRCLQWPAVQAIIEREGLFFWLTEEQDPLRRRSSLSRYIGNFRCMPYGVIGGTVSFDAVGVGRSRYYLFEKKEAKS